MSRIRTIGKCVEEIQAVDPNTCITIWNIRQLIKNGKINYWMSGNRKLVDVDQVEAYFSSKTTENITNSDPFIVPTVRRQ